MEDNLDTIMVVVEELDPSYLVQYRIVGIIDHVVSCDWRK